jgi:hypothetical protein
LSFDSIVDILFRIVFQAILLQSEVLSHPSKRFRGMRDTTQQIQKQRHIQVTKW